MSLDTAGNIYVTGFSQSGYRQQGYVTIKYAPNGNQLWASRRMIPQLSLSYGMRRRWFSTAAITSLSRDARYR